MVGKREEGKQGGKRSALFALFFKVDKPLSLIVAYSPNTELPVLRKIHWKMNKPFIKKASLRVKFLNTWYHSVTFFYTVILCGLSGIFWLWT